MLSRAKNWQNSKKNNRSLRVHIVELSTAVVEVDTKVTNASLTQNQCLQCVTFNACWDTATVRATKLNNYGMSKLGDIHYQTELNLSIFLKDI